MTKIVKACYQLSKSIRNTLFILLALTSSVICAANPELNPFDVTDLKGSQTLTSHILYREDANSSLSWEPLLASALDGNDVTFKADAWSKNQDRTPNFGFTNSTYWFLVPLKNPSKDNVTRYLDIGYPMLDFVNVTVANANGVYSQTKTGDLLPVSSRAIIHRNFIFPIDLAGESSALVLIEVKTQGALQLPIAIWEPTDFVTNDRYPLAIQFLFIGIMLSIALYNLLIWFAIRDSTYLWYVFNVVTITLVQMTLHGIAPVYLWPNIPVLNINALTVLIGLNIFAVVTFAYKFLALHQYNRLIRSSTKATAGIGLLLVIFSLFAPYSLVIKASVFIISVVAPGAILVGLYCWRKGNPLAKFFTYAWGAFLVGNLLLSFNKLAILPRTVFLEYAPQAGAAIEVILLSFALAYRMKLDRQNSELAQAKLLAAEKQNNEAQQSLLEHQKQANELLETKVAERTQELLEANKKLKEINSIDGLTQVKNRAFFEQTLKSEWSKGCRSESSMCLVLMDVDHFKAFNDNHGHQCGDACLQHVAKLMEAKVHRAGDYVTRFGGEEFSVLLCHTDLQGAAFVAEAMRLEIQNNPLIWEGEQLRITASFGVAALIPGYENEPGGLVKAADEALYAAKGLGRNLVVTHETLTHDGESKVQLKPYKPSS